MERSYIIIFDGVCNLCNGTVAFIIRHDPARKFRFAPMQSAAARALIERHYEPVTELDTFLLIQGDTCLVRSDAALAIAGELTWPWRLLAGLRIVPRTVRDYVYRLVARNRYNLFGKREVCMVPGRDVRDRFLD